MTVNDSIRQQSVDDLDVSVRLANILQQAGCKTVGDAEKALYMPAVWEKGQKSQRELVVVLDAIGLDVTKQAIALGVSLRRRAVPLGPPPEPEPIPMLLWCPMCGGRHIDEGEFATRPHATHACQHKGCGMVWKPALVATVGVEFLPGFKNEPGGGK